MNLIVDTYYFEPREFYFEKTEYVTIDENKDLPSRNTVETK